MGRKAAAATMKLRLSYKRGSKIIAMPLAATGNRGGVPPQFPFRFPSPNPRDSQMDRRGCHPPGLRAALCTANTLSPVCRQRPLSVPLLPPTPPNCASRRDQRETRRLPPQFSFGILSPSRGAATQMHALDYANGAIRQHHPLRQVEQLRLTPPTTNDNGSFTASLP